MRRTNKYSGPRANAVSWADAKAERPEDKPPQRDLEADAAVVWIARVTPLPMPVARVMALLASLGRAFQ